MVWEEEQNKDKIYTSKDSQVTHKSSNIEDSILVLEKELQNTKQDDYLKSQVIRNQINELKKLQKQYLDLESRNITKETQDKLKIEFLKLNNLTENISPIWKENDSIKGIIGQEINKRKDTIDIIWKMTIRDYIEKYVKFDWVLNSIRETEFMTKFYDILTVNYIDYKEKNKDKEWLENLDNKKWIILKEKEIQDLIELTIVKVLEKFKNIDDVKIKVLLIWWEKISIDLWKMKLKKIYEIDIKKTDDIIEKINRIDSKSTPEDIKNILLFIQNLEEYRDKIVTKYTNKEEKITIQNLKDLLANKTIKILNEKILNIKKIISSTTVKNYEEIDTLFKNARDQIENLKAINEKLNIDEIKINIQELEGYVNVDELYKISEIINISNIKSTRENVNKKITQLLIYNNDGDFIWQVNRVKFLQKLEKFKDEFNEKLLYTYLWSVWVTTINDRSNISNPELLIILRNAIKEWEIDMETMSDIIKKWYTIAFLEEFNWTNKEQIIKNLKDNELKWKKIFRKELWPEIWEDNAEKLYILSFVESSANPNKKSESWAIWRFQILSSTAEIYIDDEILKEATNKIKNNTKKNWKKYKDKELPKDKMINYILNDPELSAKVAAKYLKYLIVKSKDKLWLAKNIDEIIFNALFLYNWRFTERLILDNQDNKDEKNERLDDQGSWNDEKKEKNDLRVIINKIFDLLNSIKIKLSNWEISVEEAIKKIEFIDNNNFNKKISKWESNFRIVNLKEGWEYVSKNDIIDWIDKYTKEILNQQFLYPEQIEAANKTLQIVNQKDKP